MDSLIHIITTIVTIVFIAAVLYSLTSALRKRHRKAKVQQELAKKEHVKVANLHQYDIKPNDGYYKYPIEEKGKLRRFPQHFTAVALELANDCDYGLTSSIYTTNVSTAMEAVNRLKFGETYVNRENFEAMQGFHAGWRKSGIGGADGKHGLMEYLQTQVAYIQY